MRKKGRKGKERFDKMRKIGEGGGGKKVRGRKNERTKSVTLLIETDRRGEVQ